MSYQAIARKWRPQTFEDVTGQEPITRTLRNAIEHERLHHAYLFSGARGVGKTTTARLLAKALNCHKSHRPTPVPCAVNDPAVCPSCLEIAESRSIDVQEIDAASRTSVDNVRDAIIGSIAIAPARDRYKIFIIDEVHMLSTPAFNALLKSLEEPPPRVIFILATTERQKIPDTILSRCQLFEFRTIATSRIAERLRLIAEAENIIITDQAVLEIARAGEGSMRDAQSAFDQVISFSGSEIKPEDVQIALGITGSDILVRVMKAIADQKPAEALAVVDDLVMRGHDLRSFCRDLLGYTRDLLVANISGEASELLESFASERAELARQASLFSESDLVRFFHSMTETENMLRTATHPRYQVEIGLVKLIEMRRLAPLGDILNRLATLEHSLVPSSADGSGKKGPPPALTEGSAEKRAAAAGQSTTHRTNTVQREAAKGQTTHMAGLTAPPPEEKDSSLVDRIKSVLERRRKMFLVAALDSARRIQVSHEELKIEFPVDKRHLSDNLGKQENIKLLKEACREALGRELGLQIIVNVNAGGPGDEGPLSPEEEALREKQRLRQIAEQHPAVQSMLRKFRGQILDVRWMDPTS